MKKTKSILALFLAVSFVFTALPFCVSAETVTSGFCGENLTWTFDEAECVLTISGTGEMEDYYFTSAPWYDLRSMSLIAAGFCSLMNEKSIVIQSLPL